MFNPIYESSKPWRETGSHHLSKAIAENARNFIACIYGESLKNMFARVFALLNLILGPINSYNLLVENNRTACSIEIKELFSFIRIILIFFN